MSRNGRTNVEHASASHKPNLSNMPEGVLKAINMVKEGSDESKKEDYSDPARSRSEVPAGLKELVLFGRLTEDVTFGPFKFKVSTLSAKQQKQIVKKIFPMNNEEKVANLKFITLCESIVSVNDAPLESLYTGDEDRLSPSEKKIEVILELQSALVDKLFSKYEELTKKSLDFISDGGLDDSLKN